MNSPFRCAAFVFFVALHTPAAQTFIPAKAAIEADGTKDAPGVRHQITPDDLPPPYATGSVTNDARIVDPPRNPQLHVPPGFKIEQYASGFENPRYLCTAPNGDIFVSESEENEIKVLRDSDGDGHPDLTE